jgi:phosphoenolpyruvate carboxykinase (ATP)
MPIAATRALLSSALAGALDTVEYRVDELFGFEVPTEVPGVDSALLDPRATWRDPEAYDRRARELAQMFKTNFEKFEHDAPSEVAAAGPRV